MSSVGYLISLNFFSSSLSWLKISANAILINLIRYKAPNDLIIKSQRSHFESKAFSDPIIKVDFNLLIYINFVGMTIALQSAFIRERKEVNLIDQVSL